MSGAKLEYVISCDQGIPTYRGCRRNIKMRRDPYQPYSISALSHSNWPWRAFMEILEDTRHNEWLQARGNKDVQRASGMKPARDKR